jgi:hypothetical protein
MPPASSSSVVVPSRFVVGPSLVLRQHGVRGTVRRASTPSRREYGTGRVSVDPPAQFLTTHGFGRYRAPSWVVPQKTSVSSRERRGVACPPKRRSFRCRRSYRGIRCIGVADSFAGPVPPRVDARPHENRTARGTASRTGRSGDVRRTPTPWGGTRTRPTRERSGHSRTRSDCVSGLDPPGWAGAPRCRHPATSRWSRVTCRGLASDGRSGAVSAWRDGAGTGEVPRRPTPELPVELPAIETATAVDHSRGV